MAFEGEIGNISGNPLDDPVVPEDLVGKNYLISQGGHLALSTPTTITFENFGEPFTLTAVFQRMGNLATLAWDAQTFTGTGNFVAAVLEDDTDRYWIRRDGVCSTNIRMEDSETQTKFFGRMSITSDRVMFVFASTSGSGVFEADHIYLFDGGSFTYPCYA